MDFDAKAFVDDKLKSLRARRTMLMDALKGIERDIVDCHSAARLFEVQLPDPPQYTGFSVRNRVLALLADSEGLTCHEMQKHFHGLHPKTLGMTLFRLKRAGKVSRIGTRTWVLEPKPES